MLYLSAVTITTTGFGDIVAVTPEAETQFDTNRRDGVR
jgi:hypothetical protein